MEINTEKIVSKLQEKGIKPSYQRIKIMEYLVGEQSHPTVEGIYNHLVKEIPTLSKTTVYNTLNLLMEKDLVKLVTIDEHETRYDAFVSEHGHFKCQQCGNIYDFPIDINKFSTDELNGFKIIDKDVYFRGICIHCE